MAIASIWLAAASVWPGAKTSAEAVYAAAVAYMSVPAFWIVAAIFVVAYGGLLFWTWPERPKWRLAAHTSEPGATEPDTNPVAAARLLIETHYGSMFSLAPGAGPRRLAQLHPNNVRIGRLQPFTFTPGPEAAGDWMGSPEAYRIEVINYGTVPLLNVELILTVEFRESIRQGNSYRQGGTLCAGDLPIKFKHVGVGPDQRAVFFLQNVAEDAFVEVTLPSAATAGAIDGTSLPSVPTKVAEMGGILLGPGGPSEHKSKGGGANDSVDSPRVADNLSQHLQLMLAIKLYQHRDRLMSEFNALIQHGDQIFAGDRESDKFVENVGDWRTRLKNTMSWADQLIPGIYDKVHSVSSIDYVEIAALQLANLKSVTEELELALRDIDPI
ncbi:MAG: hypothetical protein U1C74_02475 [Phenylobacterium sp.]|nr:hypothetical protein [Phenylobacterium sp.]